MVEAQHEIEINQPAEVVFDFLADGANNPRWQPPVVATVRQGPQTAVGVGFRQTVRHPLGFKVSADYRITALERPRVLRFEVTSGGPIRPIGAYELTAVTPTSTRVRSSVAYQRRGRLHVPAPLLLILRGLFSWEASWIERAKQVLEATRR